MQRVWKLQRTWKRLFWKWLIEIRCTGYKTVKSILMRLCLFIDTSQKIVTRSGRTIKNSSNYSVKHSQLAKEIHENMFPWNIVCQSVLNLTQTGKNQIAKFRVRFYWGWGSMSLRSYCLLCVFLITHVSQGHLGFCFQGLGLHNG